MAKSILIKYLTIKEGIVTDLEKFITKVDNEKNDYSENCNYKELKVLLELIKEFKSPKNKTSLAKAIDKLLFNLKFGIKPNQDKLIERIKFDKATQGMEVFTVEYK